MQPVTVGKWYATVTRPVSTWVNPPGRNLVDDINNSEESELDFEKELPYLN
jgi:hypothetical protein